MFSRFITATVKIAFKVALFILTAAIIIPTIWFTWRMYQPMDRPEFHGVTYVKYMAWRKAANQQTINKWNAAHPTYKYTGIGDQMFSCWGGDKFGAVVNVFIGADMTFSAYKLSPDKLVQYNKVHRTDLPKINSLLNFSLMSNVFWDSFEYLAWSNATYSPEGPVAFCRVHIPTGADFDAMKNGDQFAGATR